MKVIIERDPGQAGDVLAKKIVNWLVDEFPDLEIEHTTKAAPSKVSLGIEVDSSQAVEAAKALDALTEASKLAETALARLGRPQPLPRVDPRVWG